MTDKPHRLLFADLPTPGESGDGRDPRAMKGFPLLGESELLKESAKVSGDLLIPGEGFLFLSLAEFGNQRNQSWVQGRDQQPVTLGYKDDGSGLLIDSGERHRGFAESASLMEGNLKGDSHTVALIGKGESDHVNILGGEFPSLLHPGHLNSKTGGNILLNLSALQCLEENGPENPKVEECGRRRTFPKARETDLPPVVVFNAEFSRDLGGHDDPSLLEVIGKDSPDLKVLLSSPSSLRAIDPDRNPILEVLPDDGGAANLNDGLLHLQGTGFSGFSRVIDSQTSGLLNEATGFILPLDPPKRGILSLVQRGHTKQSM